MKVSTFFICKYISSIMEEKHRAMKKLFEELKLDFITPNEKQFLKEYVNTLSS